MLGRKQNLSQKFCQGLGRIMTLRTNGAVVWYLKGLIRDKGSPLSSLAHASRVWAELINSRKMQHDYNSIDRNSQYGRFEPGRS
jgi:hypothetical protein